ncbi:MAG: hypothetical protein ABI612_25770 [Betaproteobacteria bacterium]
MMNEWTPVHEAGHAVLQIVLGLGCQHVAIVPDYEDMSAGSATHAGEYPQDEDAELMKLLAPDSFWLRHAVALYAGAEAVRRAGYKDWRAGADSDYREAVDEINKITGDEQSIDALFTLAKRRTEILMEHYWPEIEAVVQSLSESKTLSGDAVDQIVRRSCRYQQHRVERRTELH